MIRRVRPAPSFDLSGEVTGDLAALLVAVGRADAAAVAAYDRRPATVVIRASGVAVGRRLAGRVRVILRWGRRTVRR